MEIGRRSELFSNASRVFRRRSRRICVETPPIVSKIRYNLERETPISRQIKLGVNAGAIGVRPALNTRQQPPAPSNGTDLLN